MGKQMKEHVLTSQHLTISDDITRKIIKDYTREAGVRSLERTLASVCRNVALKLVKRIVLPAQNEKDLRELDKAVRDSLKIFLVSDITDALEAIFQTRSGNNLKTSLGADILNSLAPRQSGVTARSSDDTATAMDSCHPRFVSLL